MALASLYTALHNPWARLLLVPVVTVAVATVLRAYSDPGRRNPFSYREYSRYDFQYGVEFVLAAFATYVSFIAERATEGDPGIARIYETASIASVGFTALIFFIPMFTRVAGWDETITARGARRELRRMRGVFIPDALGFVALAWTIFLVR
jgi:hypothetical protein